MQTEREDPEVLVYRGQSIESALSAFQISESGIWSSASGKLNPGTGLFTTLSTELVTMGKVIGGINNFHLLNELLFGDCLLITFQLCLEILPDNLCLVHALVSKIVTHYLLYLILN